MTKEYDCIVAGLGAMGSAAAYHLAKAGHRVLGLDRFKPPHQMGSSHGLTRIIREAYFEHPLYVPLVRRAYELWAELEKKAGKKLLLQTGGLMLGDPTGILIQGAQRSANEHGLAYRFLSAEDLRQQYPVFCPSDDMVAIWEPRAGILFPELAIKAHLELAARLGADLHFDAPILQWEPHGDGVLVRTGSESFKAGKLLISVGAWMKSLVTDVNLPLAVERQVLFWFEPRSRRELFEPQRCPIFICEHAPRRFFYGFPDLGDGVKIGIHHEGVITSAELVDREVKNYEAEAGRSLLRSLLPAAAGNLRSAVVCIYTNTPDEHFVLDYHPVYQQVLIASPCSGHGFKFSPVVGELVATFFCEGAPRFDLSLFRLARFIPNRPP